MSIRLSSLKQSRFLKDKGYVIIYRYRLLKIEERYYKPRMLRVDLKDKETDVYLGKYWLSFYAYGKDSELINVQLIEYLTLSGFDDVYEWIDDAIYKDSKRRKPYYGAFYLLSKERGEIE